MLAHSSSEEQTEGALGSLLDTLRGGLIVSCQASTGSPMRDTPTIARLAASALQGGAVALRVNAPADIAAVREFTQVPIIGLHKQQGERRSVITVTDDQVLGLVAAGADIVAVDATSEVFDDIPARLHRARDATRAPLMADVSTFDEGMQSWEAGATFVGTTLSGYTPYSPSGPAPDVRLVADLAARGVRVLAEGRYAAPDDVARAFDAGAFAVVVGGAITDPVAITRRFVAASLRRR
ncbi:N-acetylmannosamine-6-phosphate 2-epimerase [Leifsonia sp. NPDC058230]|uniref:N-acetylmannosamine-6-phosphate 2-epimerase n=1 Tax=Leifsonia sp. NPDC058230 TaxID=3346391 RepID=UPI0036DF978B